MKKQDLKQKNTQKVDLDQKEKFILFLSLVFLGWCPSSR